LKSYPWSEEECSKYDQVHRLSQWLSTKDKKKGLNCVHPRELSDFPSTIDFLEVTEYWEGFEEGSNKGWIWRLQYSQNRKPTSVPRWSFAAKYPIKRSSPLNIENESTTNEFEPEEPLIALEFNSEGLF
jgi:hypothetical protein